jgi:hypothetical protein
MRRSAVALLVVAVGCGGSRPQPGPPTPRVDARELLARTPYMGVACFTPNSIACDRVGLAIALRRAAAGVTARIGRRTFVLDDGQLPGSRPPQGVRRSFAGFLQPAGLRGGLLRVQVENGRNRWTGVHPVHANVDLLVTYPDGRRARTSLPVRLSPGWG